MTKKIIFAVIFLLALGSLAGQLGIDKAWAWNNADHPWITEQAVKMVKNDFAILFEEYDDYAEALDPYIAKLKQGSSDADAFSTTVPNEIITIRFFGKKYTVYMPTTEHYYDYHSGKGAFEYFRSARQKADEYYKTAKEKWQAGEYEEAMLFLGRALHMVQDVSIPQHTEIGYKAVLNAEGYPNWASNHRDDYKLTGGGIYNLAGIGTHVHENAKLCNGYLKYVDGLNPWWIFKIFVKDDYGRATEACLKQAQKSTAGVIAMFLKEVLPEPQPVKEIRKARNVLEPKEVD
ncbi:MAG: hypothetical protein COU22_02960 [Candidatus Komeilibacteria bacterium CG10_big_fil_rev_8_21_14_0_10_41_13]|uniref:Phospholipase C n=1 Tax=Candidatus Komeilibacteria bacterium CG10_big_fil_rev_8_21_14_0_10_41_13 TaxID=1974476 RepID=A0A2M6WBW7_9BACT|nr:MAG: hypothetical protein COU22_02960 [Candidatus Komeilibacteria bacterium CG10_big_fil_rev_8_21_14_0_10_41_13]